MGRIIYLLFSRGRGTGGQKMILRHVETLRDLGFDALCWLPRDNTAPSWFSHHAPIEHEPNLRDEDVLVIPEDHPSVLERAADLKCRVVVFSQGAYLVATRAAELISERPDRFSHIMAVGARQADLLRRLYPRSRVDLVQCFADERLFRPAAEKAPRVLVVPRKRPAEAQIIVGLAKRLYAGRMNYKAAFAEDLPEATLADAMGKSAAFLSLQKGESVGLMALEAMASGCVCAGFTGTGGWAYATNENGFWAPEDDCLAAAEAISEAVAVHREGGARLKLMLEAGFDTARRWGHAAFRQQLVAFWSELAPDARKRAA